MTRIENLLINVDPVILAVACLLLVLSCISWFIILRNSTRVIATVLLKRRSARLWQQEKNVIALLTQQKNTKNVKLIKKFYQTYGSFAKIAVSGKQALHNYNNAKDISSICLKEYLASQLKLKVNQSMLPYNSGLTLLASIAASAPFIGLFGTVWGIYNTLMTLGSEQALGIQAIAVPIGEALVITALGLAVAIPALLAYNLLLRKSKKLQSELNHFAQQWHNYLLTDIVPDLSH